MKKYIKEETINVIGNEVIYKYLVVEDNNTKVVQVNDINEILLYGRTKCVNFHVHNKTLRDFRLMKNDEILMLILLDNENVDYRDFFKNNFRGITD